MSFNKGGDFKSLFFIFYKKKSLVYQGGYIMALKTMWS